MGGKKGLNRFLNGKKGSYRLEDGIITSMDWKKIVSAHEKSNLYLYYFMSTTDYYLRFGAVPNDLNKIGIAIADGYEAILSFIENTPILGVGHYCTMVRLPKNREQITKNPLVALSMLEELQRRLEKYKAAQPNNKKE